MGVWCFERGGMFICSSILHPKSKSKVKKSVPQKINYSYVTFDIDNPMLEETIASGLILLPCWVSNQTPEAVYF